MSTTWHRVIPLKSLIHLIPVVSLIVFTLVVTLPWGLPSDMSYVPPLLVLGLVFSWTMRCPGLMPPIVVFLIGIAVDVVTASPIGFWSFLLLVGYTAALRASSVTFLWPTLRFFILYAPTALVIAGLAWVIASTYFGQLIDWSPVAESLKVTIFGSPLIAIFTRLLEKIMLSLSHAASGVELV